MILSWSCAWRRFALLNVIFFFKLSQAQQSMLIELTNMPHTVEKPSPAAAPLVMIIVIALMEGNTARWHNEDKLYVCRIKIQSVNFSLPNHKIHIVPVPHHTRLFFRLCRGKSTAHTLTALGVCLTSLLCLKIKLCQSDAFQMVLHDGSNFDGTFLCS